MSQLVFLQANKMEMAPLFSVAAVLLFRASCSNTRSAEDPKFYRVLYITQTRWEQNDFNRIRFKADKFIFQAPPSPLFCDGCHRWGNLLIVTVQSRGVQKQKKSLSIPEIKLEKKPCTQKSAGACQHAIKKYYCAKNPHLKSALINLSFQKIFQAIHVIEDACFCSYF